MIARKSEPEAADVIITLAASGECSVQAAVEDGYWHRYPCDERDAIALREIALGIVRRRSKEPRR